MLDIEDRLLNTFETHEGRETAFRAAAGNVLPRRHLGTQIFLEDLRSAYQQKNNFLKGNKVRLCVTSNPRDWLAFRTVREVLEAAHTIAFHLSGDSNEEKIDEAIDDFLLRDIEHVSVNKISFGEAAKVAMAKSFILHKSAEYFCIANPVSWVSERTVSLLEKLEGFLNQKSIERQYMILTGDMDVTSPKIDFDAKVVHFDLEIHGLKIDIGSFLGTDDNSDFASVSDYKQTLESPVLITGENGAGKSLLARSLCSINILEGIAVINLDKQVGRAKMIFQDPIRQCLSRNFAQFRLYFESEWNSIYDVYHELIDLSRQCSNDVFGSTQEIGPIDPLRDNASLFQIKTLLAAIRLFQIDKIGALILDEPSWGLSKPNALSHVFAVAHACHYRGRPLMIISHKTWWDNLAKSRLEITKDMNRGIHQDDLERFHIRIKNPEDENERND